MAGRTKLIAILGLAALLTGGGLAALRQAILRTDAAVDSINQSIPGQSGAAAAPIADNRIDAVVTVAPLAGLIRPMLPEGSTLTILMAPGRSEHGYEFTPADFDRLARADVVFYVGLGLEPAVTKFLANRRSDHRKVIRFGEALGLEDGSALTHDHDHDHDAKPAANAANPTPNPAHGEPGHVHGPDCDHGPIDPHLWLDPVLVADVLPKLRDAVESALEHHKILNDANRSHLTAGYQQVLTKVQAVNTRWADALAPFKGQAIVTHHAAFGRPAERYGLRVAAVIRPIETNEPTPGQINDVKLAIAAEKVPVLFVEPQFNPAAAKRVAEAAGVRLGTLDPLGDGDWFALMDKNLAALVQGLGGKSAPTETTPAPR
jgi:zinc transport system substrate-binding protein